MTTHVRHQFACVLLSGLLLAACSASAQKAPKDQRQLEASACRLISPTPNPPAGAGSFEAISVQTSTLTALKETHDESLQEVVRDYVAAANVQNNGAVIRALNNGVKVCHHLGLNTGTQ